MRSGPNMIIYISVKGELHLDKYIYVGREIVTWIFGICHSIALHNAGFIISQFVNCLEIEWSDGQAHPNCDTNRFPCSFIHIHQSR